MGAIIGQKLVDHITEEKDPFLGIGLKRCQEWNEPRESPGHKSIARIPQAANPFLHPALNLCPHV